MEGLPKAIRPPTRGTRLTVLVAITLTTIVLNVPALATNQGSSGSAGVNGTTAGVWWTPNADWRVAKASLGTFFTPVTSALLDEYHPTDLTVTQYSTTSCTQETCVMDSNYGNNGAYGWNACYPGATSGSHPNQTCSNDWVRLNEYPYAQRPTADALACHELGHAVGLQHTSDSSCLSTALPGFTVLTSHDRGNINARY